MGGCFTYKENIQMTPRAKMVLDQFQVRKRRKQKTTFIEFVQHSCAEMGYQCRVEKAFGGRNIVVGDPDNAKVVYTAHYDTCARLPFPNLITPKNMGLYLLYQLAIVLFIFIAALFLSFFGGIVAAIANLPAEALSVLVYVVYFGLFFLLFAGPANQHTVNDNTSGVVTLLELMEALPQELRGEAAFVFFDLEETGLFGSSGFAAKHKKNLKETLVINFDCVSDGDHVLFVPQKKAAHYKPLLRQVFESTKELQVEVPDKSIFYPSDQKNFPCGVGVGVFKSTKKKKILYLDRIHTSNDTVYREENITYLVERSVELTRRLGE